MINLHPGEHVLIQKHRFWLPIAAEGISFLVIALLPFLGLLGAPYLPNDVQKFAEAHRQDFLFLSSVWALLVWVMFFVAWTNYHLDILIVTNERIIDIEQKGLFARDIAELRLENIQDIRIEVVGVLASVLNFGNIHIQTAGATKEFVVRHILNPAAIKDRIFLERRNRQG